MDGIGAQLLIGTGFRNNPFLPIKTGVSRGNFGKFETGFNFFRDPNAFQAIKAIWC